MKENKTHIKKENELHFKGISKEDFKISAYQWRYKKKIDKFLEKLQNKIVKKISAIETISSAKDRNAVTFYS